MDPSGAPLEFLRITCDSELGIAILEPSTGAERTDASGAMSGRLGGLTPGSFILECRGPFGTNLVDRISIVITGSVADGFVGFPGAAGGTLFGGNLQDLTPDFVPGEGIFISNTLFGDAGGEDETGLLDSTFNNDCDGDGVGLVGPPPDVDRDGDGLPDDDSPADDLEPFIPYTYNIGISNNTAERVTTQDISFTLSGEGTVISTGTIAFIATIQPGTAVNLTGEFVDEVTLPGSGGVVTAILFGSASAIPLPGGNGTFTVTITVSGFSETGETVVLTDTESLAFTNINNCGN